MNATDRALRYVDVVLEGELYNLASACRGTRNETLNKVAFRLGGMVAVGLFSQEQAEDYLMSGAQAIGLLEDDGEKSVRATIKSGLTSGTMSPFELPVSIRSDLEDASLLGLANGLDFNSNSIMRDVSSMRDSDEESDESSSIRNALMESGYVGSCQDDLWLPGQALEFEDLMHRGVSTDAIDFFKLGRGIQYGRRGISIPWFRREQLWTIQYRHTDGNSPKYHWHEGLPAGRLFNGDALLNGPFDFLLIVEGALNAVVMWSHGFLPVIGLPTMRGWKSSYKDYVNRFDDVVVALDFRAERMAEVISVEVPKARFWLGPSDPDEFLRDAGTQAFNRALMDCTTL